MREPFGSRLLHGLGTLAIASAMAAAAAYLAYHGLMATMRVVIGTP